MRLCYLTVGLLLVSSLGCNTIRTTFLEQNECGHITKNSRHFKKGLPVMLEVPTHVDIKIVQTDFWKIESKGNDPKKLVHMPEATGRRVDKSDVFTEQMFLVDPVRPAEGIGQFNFTFGNGADGLSLIHI